MTRRAIHIAHLKTFTGGEQAVLVAMHVECGCAVGVIGRKREVVELITNHESKGRHDVVADTGVTERTIVQPLLARKPGRIYNVHRFCLLRVVAVKSDMLCSRPVTTFTGYAEDHLALIELFEAGGCAVDPEIRAMTFDTPGRYAAVEDDHAGWVTRTVAPPVAGSIVGYRKLVKGTVVPVEVGLALPSGADGNIKWFAVDLYAVGKSCLKHPFPRPFHDNLQLFADHQHISPRVETALHVPRFGGLGGQEVRRKQMRLRNCRVTFHARLRSGEFLS